MHKLKLLVRVFGSMRQSLCHGVVLPLETKMWFKKKYQSGIENVF